MEEFIVGFMEEYVVSVCIEEFLVCGVMEEFLVGVVMEELCVKKLLVLDVNGLFVVIYYKYQKMFGEKYYVKLGNFYVYECFGCEEFLNFCFKYFIVGVWSFVREYNVNFLVNYIFKDFKDCFFFLWYQRYCIIIVVMYFDNNKKLIFLKEFFKFWVEVEFGIFD